MIDFWFGTDWTLARLLVFLVVFAGVLFMMRREALKWYERLVVAGVCGAMFLGVSLVAYG